MPHAKLAGWCFRHAYAVLFVWAALLTIGASYALQLPSAVRGHGLEVSNGSYAKVQRMLASAFELPDDPVIVYFERTEDIPQATFNRFIEATLLRLGTVDGTAIAASPTANPLTMMKGRAAYAQLTLTSDSSASAEAIAQLRGQLRQAPGLSAALTGKPVVQADVNQASRRDLQRAELIGLPIAFAVLRLAFGSFIAALLPIVLGVSSVAGAMGIAQLWSDRIPWSVFVLNVIPMAGLALGLDFALVLVGRFREELARQPTAAQAPKASHAAQATHAAQAMNAAMSTSGGAVIISATCVLLGLGGLLLLDLPIFTTVALAAMLTVGLALILSFTLLPALLAITAPLLHKPPAPAVQNPALSERWAAVVLRRPVTAALLGAAVLTACMLPLSGIRLAVPDEGSLPRSYESRLAAEAFASAGFELPGTSRVYIIAESRPMKGRFTAAAAGAVAEAANRLLADPLVLGVTDAASVAGFSPERLAALLQHPEAVSYRTPNRAQFIHADQTLFIVTLAASAKSEAARSWVRSAEATLSVPSLSSPTSPVVFTVGGQSKYEQELFDAMRTKLPQAAAFILAANLLALLLAFRSVAIAAKAILMHALGLGAAFGILVFVCQQGHFGRDPSDIAVMIPVFIFGLVFGISMDYGVFLLARMYEAYRHNHDNDAAILQGISSTGSLITSAAAIMIAVTAPFATADVAGVRQLGVGIAAAIALDATIIRLLLVPALMKLLGGTNWWPGNRSPSTRRISTKFR